MKGVGKVFEAVSTFYFNFRSFHKIFRRNDDYGNPLRIPPDSLVVAMNMCQLGMGRERLWKGGKTG